MDIFPKLFVSLCIIFVFGFYLLLCAVIALSGFSHHWALGIVSLFIGGLMFLSFFWLFFIGDPGTGGLITVIDDIWR